MHEFEKICFECGDITACSIEKQEKTFRIRGEDITIDGEFVRCHSCNNIIPNIETDEKNYQRAYDSYRKFKNMLSSEEIAKIRERYRISQRTFAKLLGWSHATLSRYESGALQSVDHNNILFLLSDPRNMACLLRHNRTNLTNREFLKTQRRLESNCDCL